MILDAYLTVFAKGSEKAVGWYALDLFAGTGLNWSTTRGQPILDPSSGWAGCSISRERCRRSWPNSTMGSLRAERR